MQSGAETIRSSNMTMKTFHGDQREEWNNSCVFKAGVTGDAGWSKAMVVILWGNYGCKKGNNGSASCTMTLMDSMESMCTPFIWLRFLLSPASLKATRYHISLVNSFIEWTSDAAYYLGLGCYDLVYGKGTWLVSLVFTIIFGGSSGREEERGATLQLDLAKRGTAFRIFPLVIHGSITRTMSLPHRDPFYYAHSPFTLQLYSTLASRS